MRTSILCAAFLGLFAAGCAGELSGTGGDDVQPPENCGNGVVDSDETCDDGNTTSGDGCSSACATEQSSEPRLNATVDKTTVDTELAKTETITLNLASQGGFAESVTVAASVVDGTGAPITAITVVGPTTVDVAADVTTPAQYMVTIPTDATGTALAATLKLDVTSSLGAANATSTLNVAAIYTVDIAAGTGADDPSHPLAGKTFTILRGTLLRMVNNDNIVHITHGTGFPHEDQNGGDDGLPGATYEVNTTVVAPGTGKLYGCHSHGTATYATVTLL